MATYFHGNPEIQAADGLQTLVLMNPDYVQYSNTPPPLPNNLVFPHAPPLHAQQFVGIPLPVSTSTANQDPGSHEISPLHGLVQRIHYNMYNPIDTSRETPRAQQGLSLSLSSQHPGYGSQAQAASGEDMRVSCGSGSSGSGVTNGVPGVQSVLLSSKFLKAAQELLDEVVTVNNTEITKNDLAKKSSGDNTNTSKAIGESSVAAAAAAAGDGSGGGEADAKHGAELTTAERQEIQMKKAKLISMLDEVDQRYRQYHHQMQVVTSSFEQAAGTGSAKTYTSLALKTISKQFRCLKDAITGQIRAAHKSLGEEDCLGGKLEGSSRLKFVDHYLRQQRALQQLGMVQHNAWRPQRGLPERSVSVLRSWLFEHFLHPYPKDSDKIMLAKQTGLTRSQVSNWFINARVRLWKPMVEEMYLEEIKEYERNGSKEKTSKSLNDEDSTSKSTAPDKCSADNMAKSFSSKQDNISNQIGCSMSISMALTSPLAGNIGNQSEFSFIGSSELEGITQGSPKKPRSTEILQPPMDFKQTTEANNDVSVKFGKNGYAFMGTNTDFMGGFGQYPIGEIGRFEAEQFTPRFSGNGVSLTLGLPHCENLSLSGPHHSFLTNQTMQMGRRLDVGEPNEFGSMTISPSTPHSSAAAFGNISIQNRKRFAAQLLPDFVA
ncbi:BEL1-like homeodomain protein 1 [Hibiscus syriacus]|uniref:BEL1-like homeodomain protein 1 n=1 Tax=Hibiscus syriacus TaxID=106335 RepID=A0A6A2ZFB4_HIBSY|nr:BEL1-like homeodomain protein 1 [Hibiscus syriacus]XP_039015536.1 BEL1-like homeodomain protein 1 [Hibiscus syriacus]XP_039015537.1 BEL1-like homeodomain protein 1 [Hibiscus syriacus]KAE8690568.1 BEL1-like homeodomain protein 1 [Hibiscus syriacus]